jgi:acyl carrier protein
MGDFTFDGNPSTRSSLSVSIRPDRKERMMEIAQRVKEIIAKNLDVNIEDIKTESSFINDLGADSLAIVELVLALEEEFELDIPDEETEKIKTVQDAIDYIQAHGNKR